MSTTSPMVEAEGLRKRYGDTQALDGVDLSVARGGIIGLLGPNGAGKSTTVRILTTMTRPDGGRATVAGHDVATDGAGVRRSIGVTGQDATLDELLTGRQNLAMVGELSGLARRRATSRAVELLEQFTLTDAADRVVKGYSGGMRRRLDLAASLVAHPPVLFLDEPTTGLDPASRQRMWDIIREMVADGTTLLLTTQYLDEADVLADRIAVIDHGRVIAEGTPHELKAATGEAQLHLTLAAPHPGVGDLLAALVAGPVHVSGDGRSVQAPVRSGSGLATAIVRELDAAGAVVDDIAVHQPSLDDVFMALTGAPHVDDRDAESDDEPQGAWA
jgi:ABC-2 type transport system ATP-binding protein